MSFRPRFLRNKGITVIQKNTRVPSRTQVFVQTPRDEREERPEERPEDSR